MPHVYFGQEAFCCVPIPDTGILIRFWVDKNTFTQTCQCEYSSQYIVMQEEDKEEEAAVF